MNMEAEARTGIDAMASKGSEIQYKQVNILLNR
jgi:hypothetical protein